MNGTPFLAVLAYSTLYQGKKGTDSLICVLPPRLVLRIELYFRKCKHVYILITHLLFRKQVQQQPTLQTVQDSLAPDNTFHQLQLLIQEKAYPELNGSASNC